MKSQSVSTRESIRDEWSDQEREARKSLADRLQFNLNQILVLSELASPKPRMDLSKRQKACSS